MSLLAIYLIASTFLLGFASTVWTTNGAINVTMKLVLTAAAMLGAAMCAKIILP